MTMTTRSGRVLGASVGVGLAAAALCLVAWPRGASGDPGDPADDGVPPGTVAYFLGGACPAGWKPADAVEGRLVVAVADGANAGHTVGSPLGDREDREHAHDYAGQVALGDKAIAAADGSNDQGAAAGTYGFKGTTAKATSGLGFAQVQACEKP